MNHRQLLGAILILASVVLAQTIHLSGAVIDSETGMGLGQARVSLWNRGLSDSTDSTGKFSILGEGSGILPRDRHSGRAPVLLSKGVIGLDLVKKEWVVVHSYTLEGRMMGSIQREFEAGIQAISLESSAKGSMVYQVSIGQESYTLFSNGLGRSSLKIGSTNPSGAWLPRAQELLEDTLIIERAGYATRKVFVSNSVDTNLRIPLSQGLPGPWTFRKDSDLSGWILDYASSSSLDPSDTNKVPTGVIRHPVPWIFHDSTPGAPCENGCLAFTVSFRGSSWVQYGHSNDETVNIYRSYPLAIDTRNAQLTATAVITKESYPFVKDVQVYDQLKLAPYTWSCTVAGIKSGGALTTVSKVMPDMDYDAPQVLGFQVEDKAGKTGIGTVTVYIQSVSLTAGP